MFCYKCGKKIPDGGLFCAFCGAKMIIPDEEVVVEETPAEVETEKEVLVETVSEVEVSVKDEPVEEVAVETEHVEEVIVETENEKESLVETVSSGGEGNEPIVDTVEQENVVEEVKPVYSIPAKTVKSGNIYQEFYGVNNQKDLSPDEISRSKKKNRLTGFILVVLTAISIVIVLLNVLVKPTINLNEYMTVVSEGYDTIGTVNITIDKERLEKDYNQKIGLKKSKEYSMKTFLSDVASGNFDVKEGLSNGDVVTFKWSNDDEKALDIYGIKLKYEDIEYTVEGLKEVTKFDPFNGVEIEFSGIAPNGKAEIVGIPDSGVASDFVFRLENQSDLDNGDKVTANAYMYYVDDIYQYCAENYGMIPNALTKEYTVDGIDRYVSSMNDISKESLEQMKEQAQAVYDSKEAAKMGKGEKLLGVDYVGNYLLSSKNRDGNIVFLVYKVAVNNKYVKDSGKYNKNNELYWYILYKDLIVNSAGETMVDVSKYDSPANRVYFDSGVEDWFSTTSWYYHGYESIDELYNNVISAESDKYNIENTIDESLAQVYEMEEDELGEEGKERIAIKNIVASSELNVKAKDGSTYHAQNMIDGNPETAWIEGVDGLGIGEYIYIEFDGVKSVSEIDIYPGFLKTKNRYLVNGQPTRLLIEWEGGQSEIGLDRVDVSTDDEPFELDEMPIAKLNLDEAVQTSYLKFTIIDAVGGSKYEDVAITDVSVYSISDSSQTSNDTMKQRMEEVGRQLSERGYEVIGEEYGNIIVTRNNEKFVVDKNNSIIRYEDAYLGED